MNQIEFIKQIRTLIDPKQLDKSLKTLIKNSEPSQYPFVLEIIKENLAVMSKFQSDLQSQINQTTQNFLKESEKIQNQVKTNAQAEDKTKAEAILNQLN